MSDKVIIFDTTLRDGEQSAGVAFSLEQKLEIACQLEALGVDVIEAGFPCSSPEDFECVEAVSRTIKKSIVCALARSVKTDIQRAWDAVQHAVRPRIHLFINTSDIQIEHQLKKTRDEVLAQAREMVAFAKSLTSDIEFSPMDATRSDPEYLAKMVQVAIEAGATTINIPDSVGYALPDEIATTFKHLREKVPGIDGIVLSFHGHNDLGMATANSLVALQHGARQIEGTINGIGERAGNTALEEVIMIVHTRAAALPCETAINIGEIFRTSKLVERHSGLSVQQNKAIVGKNAFRHGSGIHQDGIIKHRDTWEIMDPKLIGVSQGTQIVLGKLSGRNGLKQHLEKLGYSLNDEDLTHVFHAFKNLTAKKREIDDRDLESLVATTTHTGFVPQWELLSIQVISGIGIIPTATVILKSSAGEKKAHSAMGTGPIDAICEAVNFITKCKPVLELYDVRAVTEGIDAQGEVVIRVSYNGRSSIGKGSDTDIFVASAQAYVAALSRVLPAVVKAATTI